jgi:hypothetical protein
VTIENEVRKYFAEGWSFWHKLSSVDQVCLLADLGRLYAGAAQTPTWRPIETAPKDGTIVLAWWLNGEQHTGSTDGLKWFPAWEHQDKNWMLPQLWKPLVDPDEATKRTAVALAVSSTWQPSFCSRCGGKDPDCYICGTVVASTHSRPFYGAECPSYPDCSGGCGLGCTKKIESAKAASQVTSTERT